MKRLPLCLLLGAAACRCNPPPAAPPAQILRVAIETEPPTLCPLVEHDYWTTWLTLNVVYQTLIRQDPHTGAFSPDLAERFDAPDDHTLRFTLRERVRWHDGHPFSADDVAFTLDRVRGPGAAPEFRADFTDLTEVLRPSPRELVLRFAKPQPLALQALAHLPILAAHAFQDGDLKTQAPCRAPIGTGPFRFVEWKSGDRIVLARNDDFAGPRPSLDRIEARVVRDREAAFELARRGEIDLLWRLSAADLDRVASAPPPGMKLVPWRLPSYSFVVWNERRPGLSDPRVRRALALLTDRARWIQAAYRGRAQPISGPYPLGSPSYDPLVAPWPYDPAAARALLDQAGVRDTDGDGKREVDGKPFTISFLLVAGSKTLEPLVTLMQEDLVKAGITLEAVPTEWGALLERLRAHSFDAAALQWTMQPVQSNYSLFFSAESERGQNYGGYKSPDADRLLGELQHTPPGEARVALDHRLHRRVHDDQPYLFLACPEVDSLVSARLAGFDPSQDGFSFERMALEPPK